MTTIKKDKPSLIILQGPPASGKSTWTKNYVKTHDNVFVVSRDGFRDMNYARDSWHEPPHHGVEAVITQVERASIAAVLTVGWDCIVDATNLRQKVVNELVEIATDNGADVWYQKFDANFDRAMEWDQKRVNSVGSQVMEGFYERYGFEKPEITPEMEDRWASFRKCFLIHLKKSSPLGHIKDLLNSGDVVINTAEMCFMDGWSPENVAEYLRSEGIVNVISVDLRHGYIQCSTRKGRPHVYMVVSDEKKRCTYWQDHHDKFKQTEVISNSIYQDKFIRDHWTVMYEL